LVAVFSSHSTLDTFDLFCRQYAVFLRVSLAPRSIEKVLLSGNLGVIVRLILVFFLPQWDESSVLIVFYVSLPYLALSVFPEAWCSRTWHLPRLRRWILSRNPGPTIVPFSWSFSLPRGQLPPPETLREAECQSFSRDYLPSSRVCFILVVLIPVNKSRESAPPSCCEWHAPATRNAPRTLPAGCVLPSRPLLSGWRILSPPPHGSVTC